MIGFTRLTVESPRRAGVSGSEVFQENTPRGLPGCNTSVRHESTLYESAVHLEETPVHADSTVHLQPGPHSHLMERRSFLSLMVGSVAVGALAACTPTRTPVSSEPSRPAGAGGTLRVPSILDGEVTGTERIYRLVAQAGETAFVAAGSAATWGFNGTFLGPTIRMRRGETVRMRVQNDLPDPTTVHWHGMHLPAVSDGTPHQTIPAGSNWSPTWIVDQPAATLWYHPHPHGATEMHVHRGLAGMLIVEDGAANTGLPQEYGIDDIPLIIQDRTFDTRGQMLDTDRRGPGMLGNTVLVNGIVAASLVAAAPTTRFRILNASTARSYNLGFADDRPFEIIASDGGLLPTPVTSTRLLVTPGERFEILLQIPVGESVTLRSFPQDLGDVAGTTGGDDEFTVLEITGPSQAEPLVDAPVFTLPALERYDAAEAAVTRRFEFSANRINGVAMDMTRVDEVVTVDQLEVWEALNTARTPHNFHIHGVQFQIIEIGGTVPPPELAGWKDTVYLPPTVTVRLAMRFSEYTDPAVPYMYHCHLLWHEDLGMMGQFVVIRPGEQPGVIATETHTH